MAIEIISGLDDLFYDIILKDESTGEPVETGTVTMQLVSENSLIPLGSLPQASQVLTHVADGRWVGVHDDVSVALAILPLRNGQRFDRIAVVAGLGVRRLAKCQKAHVVTDG